MAKERLTLSPVFKTVLALVLASQLSACAGMMMAGVVGGAMAVNDRRSIGTQIDDGALELKISQAVSNDEGLDEHARIQVISMNQRVLLVGQAPNRMLKERALRIARETPNVAQVHDQIRIGSPVGFTTRSNDSWITTKVKSRMFGDEELDGLRVKVLTENGEVFLLGLVNKEEARMAVDVARNTTGVRKVVKVFEYY